MMHMQSTPRGLNSGVGGWGGTREVRREWSEGWERNWSGGMGAGLDQNTLQAWTEVSNNNTMI